MADCNGELPLNRMLDKQKAYLVTPYYKTIPEIQISGPSYGPAYNYSDYDKFCLTTNLDPIFSSLGLTFDLSSLNLDDKMRLCVIPKNNGSYFQMSEKTQYTLQNEVDFVCHNLYHLSLLYDLNSNTRYPKAWLYHIFNALEIDKSLGPSFVNGRIYVALDENIDYLEVYTQAFDDLMIQISQLYNTGAVICTPEFAKNWDLDLYKNGIYLANWNDTRITQDKSQFLYQIMTFGTYLITIPDNILCRHYLARTYPIIIDGSQVRIKPTSLKMLQDILNIISETIRYDQEYNIVELQLQTTEQFQEYKDLISRTLKVANFASYQIPNPKTPVMMSVLILGKFENLRLKVNKILGIK